MIIDIQVIFKLCIKGFKMYTCLFQSNDNMDKEEFYRTKVAVMEPQILKIKRFMAFQVCFTSCWNTIMSVNL